MPALSEMTDAEKHLAHDDPDLLAVLSLTEDIRGNELLRAYKLRQKLEKSSRSLHEEIIDRWAAATGRSKGAWLSDLKWANAIDPDDLVEVFEEEEIPQREWVQRVGTSHLRVIARAKLQDTHLLLTSRERAEWIRRSYHSNLSVAELEAMLRDHDLLPPKRGAASKPIEAGKTTSIDLLRMMADSLQEQGRAIDFSGMLAKRPADKPIDIVAFLQFLAGEYKREHPGAEFRLGEGN
mgnify:CR=1 FL=1